MTVQEASQTLQQQLSAIYDQRESATITDMVLENITGLKKIDRIIHKTKVLSGDETDLFNDYATQLMDHKPVQYVLQQAWFYGLKFFVNEHVLIPRPETEELVQWLVAEDKLSPHQSTLKILDIGTGSGCIAIAIKKNFPSSDIDACDISAAAIQVAQKNAQTLEANINFMQIDILNRAMDHNFPIYDRIVSNPPYIPLKDKATMKRNVLGHEPHLALFVDDDDALIFYRAIADFATKRLSSNGKIFVELHEALSGEVQKVFLASGFSFIEIRKDMQGKNRMMKAMKH